MARSHNINLISGRIFRTLAMCTYTQQQQQVMEIQTCHCVYLCMYHVRLCACKTHQNSHKQDTTNVKFMYDAQVMTVPVVKCLAQHFTLCTSFFPYSHLSLSLSLSSFLYVVSDHRHIQSHSTPPLRNKICNEHSVVYYTIYSLNY